MRTALFALALGLVAPHAALADAQGDVAGLSGAWLLATAGPDDAPRCNVQLNGGNGDGPYRVTISLSCTKIAAFSGRVHGWQSRGSIAFVLTGADGQPVVGFSRQDDITYGSDDHAYVMERVLPE